jgi:uncharacterized OB-fold protein
MVNMMANRIPIREGVFMESPDGGTLLANKCKSCGQIFFPKAVLCLSCFNEDMEELKLSRMGKLYSYTIGYMPSMHFEPPYAIGYVDMPEGVKIFAQLKMTTDKPFKIGMDMEVVIEKLWQEDDSEIIGYKFKPV